MNFDAIIAKHPAPADDPISRLRHTVAIITDNAAGYDPDDIAVLATSGLYPGINRTGITYGDLAALLAMVDAPTIQPTAPDGYIWRTKQHAKIGHLYRLSSFRDLSDSWSKCDNHAAAPSELTPIRPGQPLCGYCAYAALRA